MRTVGHSLKASTEVVMPRFMLLEPKFAEGDAITAPTAYCFVES